MMHQVDTLRTARTIPGPMIVGMPGITTTTDVTDAGGTTITAATMTETGMTERDMAVGTGTGIMTVTVEGTMTGDIKRFASMPLFVF